MKEILKRTITGLILVAVMISAILGGHISFLIFFGLLLIACMYEFYTIFKHFNIYPQIITGIITGILLYVLFYYNTIGILKSNYLYLLIVPVVISLIWELFHNHENPFANIALTWMGVLYIAIPISMLIGIAFRENIYQYNYNLVLSYFILIWTYDTMAYIVGVSMGKHKIFERISPKKTWEGALGGLLFTCIVAYILSFFYKELSVNQWLLYGILIAIFGTLGDLVESMLKRTAGIKDSGNLLPGHGGLLDRFDALFLAIPIIYLYLQFV